jgi:hypothetical protein
VGIRMFVELEDMLGSECLLKWRICGDKNVCELGDMWGSKCLLNWRICGDQNVC